METLKVPTVVVYRYVCRLFQCLLEDALLGYIVEMKAPPKGAYSFA